MPKKQTKKSVKKKKPTKKKKQEELYLEPIDEKNEKEITSMVEAAKIQNPVITTNQIIALLHKTPDKYKYERKGAGGNNFTYVSGGYVKKTLNRIFGWNWSFKVIDKFREDNEVIVHGRLSIKNEQGKTMIVKEDFGKKEILNKKGGNLPVSIGNDYKSATTDCLKRCAYQLGLASDVYAPLEYKELKEADESIVYDIKDGRYQIICIVCGKKFTSDKDFMS